MGDRSEREKRSTKAEVSAKESATLSDSGVAVKEERDCMGVTWRVVCDMARLGGVMLHGTEVSLKEAT